MVERQNISSGPEPMETADLHFKLASRLKIFEANEKPEGTYMNAIAVSQRYGLIFISTLNGFVVIKTSALTSTTGVDDYLRKEIMLGCRPSHICIDCNQDLLAVGCFTNPGCLTHIYKISQLSQEKVTPLKSIPLLKNDQNQFTELRDLVWQPNGCTLTCCFTDGSVLFLTFQGSKCDELFLPPSIEALCLCWSPKGKQIIIGSKTGILYQYKPDLKLVKKIPPPQLYPNGIKAVSIFWISNYQFAVAYKEDLNEEAFPVIVILNAVKNEPVSCIMYDDITYSNTHFRTDQIYMSYLQAWNLMFFSSSNSMEVAVLHMNEDGVAWEQWLLGDASRAELPLNADRQETFPLGLAIDYTSSENIVWGENSLPPMPRLLIISHEGFLCIFNIVNLTPNAPQLCSQPKETFDDSLFTKKSSSLVLYEETLQDQEPSQPAQTSLLGNPPQSFGFPTNLSFAPMVSSSPQPPFASLQQTTASSLLGPPPGPAISSLSARPSFGTLPTQPMANQSVMQPFGLQSGQQFQNQTTQSSLLKQSLSLQTTPLQENESVKQFPIASNQQNLLNKFSPQPMFEPKTNTEQITFGAKQAEQAISFAAKTIAEQESSKTDKKSPAMSPVPDTPEPPAVDSSIYLNAVMDEIDQFNSELEELKCRISEFRAQIGTNDEKIVLRTKLNDLNEFWKELKEITVSQTNEIHSVKSDMMEAFAWLEDAKSRNFQRKNPTYVQIKKSERLDPISSRNMKEITDLEYYIKSQLKLLNNHLDKEWMEHQDHCREDVKSKMIIPSMEGVYKTMLYQVKILSKQRALIEDLKEKLSEKTRKVVSQNVLMKNSNALSSTNSENSRLSELSKLAENLLQLNINREESAPLNTIESWKLIEKAQVNAIAERQRKLSVDKVTALRESLSERDTIRTRPVKSIFEASTFIRNISIKAKPKPLPPLKQVKEKQIHIKETVPAVSKPVQKPLQEPATVSAKPTAFANAPFTSIIATSTPLKNQQVAKSPLEATGDSAKTEKLGATIEIAKKVETPKSVFSFGPPSQSNAFSIASNKNSVATATAEEKTPIASLTGIVSNIGKENEAQAQRGLTAFSFKAQNPDIQKGTFTFGANKTETVKTEAFPFSPAAPAKKDQEFTFSMNNETSKAVTTATISPLIQSAPLKVSSGTPATTVTSPPVQSAPFKVLAATPAATAPAKTATTVISTSVAATVTTTPAVTSVVTEASSTVTTSSTKSTFAFTPSTTSSIFAPKSGTSIFGGTTAVVTSDTAAVTTSSAFSTFSFSSLGNNSKFSFGPSTAPIFGSSTTPLFGSQSSVSTAATTAAASTTTSSVFGTPKPTEAKTASTATNAVPTTAQQKLPETETVSSTANDNQVTTTTGSEFFTPKIASTPLPESTESTQKEVSVSKAETTTDTAQVSVTPTTASSIFGSIPTTRAKTEVVSSAPVTSTNVFSLPLFSNPPSTTAAPIFGGAVSTAAASVSQAETPATTASSIFGQSLKTPAVSTSNIFSTPTTTGSIFGQPTVAATPTTTAAPTKTPTTTSANVFASSSPAGVFGTPQAATTTTNVFNQPTPATTASSFGQKPDEVNQTTNLFGQLLSGNTSGSIFGSAPTTTTTNLFSQTGFEQTSKNIFGGASTTSSAPLFGTTSNAFQPSTNIFGQSPAATTSANIFGQPAATTSSSSFFGQTACSPFGGTSTAAPNQNPFGTTSSSSFGSKPVFGQSLFGQNSTSTSVFGGSNASNNNTSGSIFGGSTTSSSGLFQTSSTNTFGTAAPGPFSSGQSSVAQAGFGSPTSFQKPMAGGFGSAPVFGGAASAGGFGSAPTFGGTPTFGSSSAFGSPQKVFGSPQGSFGQNQSPNTSFETLANQNTVGFGSLAQQSPSPGFGNNTNTFGSPSSFGNSPSFGGNSFSSWR